MLVHPAYRGTQQQDAVLTQTIDALIARLRQRPREDDGTPQIAGYANEDETAHIALLERLGFGSSPHPFCRTGSRFWSACDRKTPSGGRWRIRMPSSRIRK
jgi:hypothetical protein